MKKLFILLLVSHTLFAQKVTLPVDASHSVISFSVAFAGGVTNIEGRFNKFSGEIGYANESDPTTMFANIKIDVSSINTGDAERDNDLKGETFFNVQAHPEISFTSQNVVRQGDGYLINGTFKMMGLTKNLSFPFKYTHTTPIAWVFGEPRIAAKATLVLDRTEFGIPKRGWDNVVPTLGTMALSKEVQISLIVQGVGPGLAAILSNSIDEKGTKGAIETYLRLEKENNGKETYGFNSNALLGFVFQLMQKNKLAEALEIAKFNVQKYPDSHVSYYSLALVLEKSNDKKGAIENLEKAIKIKPDFQRGKDLLTKLKS